MSYVYQLCNINNGEGIGGKTTFHCSVSPEPEVGSKK